jgi:hypothetical protein
MQRNSISDIRSPNFANIYQPPVYGASDPYVAYTATQLYNIGRSFFSTIGKDDWARSGILPEVSLASINNLANWTTTPPKEDFSTFIRLSHIAGKGENPGLIGRDVDRYAFQRAIMGQGIAPYNKLTTILEENLTDEQIKNLQKTTTQEKPTYYDVETGLPIKYEENGKKVPATKFGEATVIKQDDLKNIAKEMLNRGTLYRLYATLKADNLLPNLLVPTAIDASEGLDPRTSEMKSLQRTASDFVGISDYTASEMSNLQEISNGLFGDLSNVAQFNSSINPFDVSGISEDIVEALKPTPEELRNGFDGVEWFNKSINPEVVPYLAQKGIDENTVRSARGHREALYFIQDALSTTTIQERIERYTRDAGFLKTNMLTQLGYSLPTILINDPDLAITISTGGIGRLIKGASLGTYQLLKGTTKTQLLKKAMQETAEKSKLALAARGLYQISVGDLPVWFKNRNAIEKIALGTGIVGLQGVGANYRGQLDRIAWANTALLTDATDEVSKTELAISGALGGLFGGIVGSIAAIGNKNYTLEKTSYLDQEGNQASMIGATPDQTAPITAGLEAAVESNTVNPAATVKDPLEPTGENIKDDGVVISEISGRKTKLREDDIFQVNEIEPEKVMSGEYKLVKDSRTGNDILVRQDAIDAAQPKVKTEIIPEEPKLTELEKTTIEAEKFGDASDISTKAKMDDGLVKASENSALNRLKGEGDSNYLSRLINGDEIKSSSDILRAVSEPTIKPKTTMGRLVDFRRRLLAAKNLLKETKHNKGDDWTNARISELDNLEKGELAIAINKAMNAGDNNFTKLPANIKEKMTNFVIEHAGKSDDEIDRLIKETKDMFNKSQKDMLKRRLKTPVTRAQRRKLIEEVLSDNSISEQSRKILNTLLGTPENLSLNQRRLASRAYRKEKYFLNKASYLTSEFYLDFRNVINEALDEISIRNKDGAKNNSDLILSLVRGALINLRLPERAGTSRITIKLDNLKENVLGSNKLTFDKNGVGLLEITLDKNTLVKALETGDKALIAHTVLHELGHAYSYFATPTEIIRMMTMYSEFLDLDVLEAFVNITESTRGSLADSVGVYAAINPGEVFANHFANQGLVTSLDAAAKLKLSFLEAFTTYVEDIINGIADVFTFNDTTKLKLKRISKVLNEVIENISTTKPDATTLIDMVKEERDFSIALKKASFYDKDKKKYQKNIIKLIKDNLPKKITGEDGRLLIDFLTDGYAERKDFSIDKDFLFDIRLIAPEISSIKTTSRDLFSALQAIKKEMGMENFYLNSIEDEFDLLLNPEKIFSYQLFRDLPTISKPDSFNTIRNIVKTAELTSTRVALERYLKNNKLETLPTIESALNFIKTQGDYISAGLTRYLNDRVFGLSRINENIQMLETLNSKAKTKSILRQNVFELPSGQQVFRPKFDTGLDDTSLVLYHGGTWTGNKEPNMLHSGTLKAAFDRTKHSLDSNNKYNIVAFEVSKEANIIEMVDTGINHTDFESYWKSITEAYDNKPDLRFDQIIRDIVISKKKADEIINKIYENARRFELIREIENVIGDVDLLKTIFKEAGVDIIKYKNVGEDIGSTSFVIVNPRVISIKANGKFEPDGTWAWRSTYTGRVLESTTRDLHDINYRGSESLEKLISLLPDLKGITADLSEAIGVQKEVEFKPTSITEVTSETKPLLQKELDEFLIKIEGLKPSFFTRLASVVRAKTTLSIDLEDAKSTLTNVWLASRAQLDKGEIPTILKMKTENEIFRFVVGFKKKISLKELDARAKGGKVGELDAFEDVEVAAGQANKNNETIDDGAMDIDSLRKRQSDFKTWLNSLNTVSEENKQAIDALFDIRVQSFKGTKTKTLQDIKPGEVPKLPAGSGEKLYFAMNPEQKTEYDAAVASGNKDLIASYKKKFTNLVTRIQKLEKKLLDKYRATPDKPIHAEKVLHDAVLEKVAKSDEPVLKTEQTKQENLEKDSILEEENQATLVTKEEVPEVAAPILKGKGGDEMFTTTSVLDDPRTMQLGHMFTTERRAAGVRKKLNRRFTVRARVNKSRVFRIVNNGKSVFETIKTLPEPILRIAGINKSIMERVLGSVVKEHSESQAMLVILNKLNEEGYTAIEIIDQNGNLIGDMPTSLEHVTILDHVDHEGLIGPKYAPIVRKGPIEPIPVQKNTVEVEPTPTLNPEELPVKVKDGESLEKTQEIETRESDVPQISEEEAFIHHTLNAVESLRWNGTTPKLIKIALLRFMKKAKELRENLGQPLTGIPPEFKAMLYKVLRVAEAIAEQNRSNLGKAYEEINNEFWTIFDRQMAGELVARGEKTAEISIKTINEIIDFAHAKVNENIELRNKRDGTKLPEFIKPLKPDEFEFTVSKPTNKYPDGVKFKKGSFAETLNLTIEKNAKAEPKKAKEAPAEPTKDEVENAVIAAINNDTKDNTMLLRESSWIGKLFGGSQREGANWWRRLLNGARNLIEMRTETQFTTHSLSNITRTIAAWVDPSKAHIHNLVGGGKNARKSWEAIAHEVTRITSSLRDTMTSLIRAVPNEKIVENINIAVMKTFASKGNLNRADIDSAVSVVIPKPSRELLDKVFALSQKMYGNILEINKKILDLENETGWIELKDKDGNPIKPSEYFPITFIQERVLPTNRDSIIKEMVRVRQETLRKSDDLSTDIMLSMGWLFDNSNDVQAGILDKGREVEGRRTHFLTEANFDKQTLINLEVNRYKAGTDARTFAEMAGEASNKHFVYEDSTTGDLVVCRIPKKKADLSLADLAKYNEVVNGSTNYIGKQWKANFPGMPVSPLYTIMSELLDSKLYQGRYNKNSRVSRGNPLNPMTLLRDRNRIEYGIAVKPLTWDEVLASPELLKVTRNDPLEAYMNFLKARGFDLLMQVELDRMLGLRGVRFSQFMSILQNKALEDARAEGAPDTVLEGIVAGFNRISNEYLYYKGQLSVLTAAGESIGKEFAEVGLNLVRGTSAPIWGITSLAEPVQHLIKGPGTVGTIQTIKNMWDGIRIIIGDKRFSTSAALMDEMRDAVFFIDLIRSDLADRVINADLDGVPKLSRWFDRIKATREDSRFGLLSDTSDVFGNVGVEIGSVRYTTYFARKLAMQRFGASLSKFINNGAAERFFAALNRPDIKSKMSQLEELAFTDPKAEAELFKMFKGIARETGFGDSWDIALAMNKYGLNTVEKLSALKKAFNMLGSQYSKRGLINWSELKELFHENSKRQIIPNVDGKIGMDAFESLIYTAETLTTTKGAISTPRGLNKELRFQSRTAVGRLMKALLGWSQSFFSNIIGGYSSMRESTYLSSLVLYAGLTAATEYLREWIGGRDLEDIEKEMERNPETYLFRMMYATPVLGVWNGLLTNSLGFVSSKMGGPLRSFSSPISYPGLNIALDTPFKMAGKFTDLVMEQIPSGKGPEITAGFGEVIGYNTLMNKSPIAIPARIMVEAGVINEADAMGKYMTLIKKRKNHYTGSKKPLGRPLPGMSKERKDSLIREALRKTQEPRPQMGPRNTGVSEDLANLLEDMSNQQ